MRNFVNLCKSLRGLVKSPTRNCLVAYSHYCECTSKYNYREHSVLLPFYVQRSNYCHSAGRANFPVKNKGEQLTPPLNKYGILRGESRESVAITSDNSPADTFGTLAQNESFDSNDCEEEQLEATFVENRNGPNKSSKLRTKQYADIIKQLIHEKKLEEAIDVLETRMIKEDRVNPETYIFSLLISACGRFGYSKKAFQLYNQMKKRGLKVNEATYTALFNACANSPWAEDGLQRATHLRELMREKGIQLNSTHYHAMIKAFGRCGDITTAFRLVDEMVDHQHRLTDATFNFLLQACIADKEAGFRHALLVWHKMLQKRISPSLYTYNLILRTVRDCGLGSTDVAQNVLDQICGGESSGALLSGTLHGTKEEHKCFPPEDSNASVGIGEIVSNNSNTLARVENRPNLLAAKPHLGSIISLTEVTKPQDRLLLIGGSSGFLQQMHNTGVVPDIKTFTLLLDNLSPSMSAENALMSAMKKDGVRMDVDFFNMLIKKRSMRFDYTAARDVLQLIQRAKLHPDIVTFGVLALGCNSKHEAQQLLADMNDAGYRMNVEILGAMLKQACVHHNFEYIMEILYRAKEEEIKPSAQFLKHLENLNASCRQLLNDKNNGLYVPDFVQNDSFRKDFRTFSFRYRAWLREVKPEAEIHPWEQFNKKQKPAESEHTEKRKYRRNPS